MNGKIVQITGPVVDVEFPGSEQIPGILEALTIAKDGKHIVLEVAKHLEPGKVRAISLDSTDGLRRGEASVLTLLDRAGQLLQLHVYFGRYLNQVGLLFCVVGRQLTRTCDVG